MSPEEWQRHVDESLKRGDRRFVELAQGQSQLMDKIQENTEATMGISTQLKTHIGRCDEQTIQMQPAMDAIESMKSGVRVIGKIGGAVAFIGRWLRRTVIWCGPLVAAGIAAYHFFKTGGKL